MGFMNCQERELSNYIKQEWNNDRSWLGKLPAHPKHRTRIEYGMVVRYKLGNLVASLFGSFLPEPCC